LPSSAQVNFGFRSLPEQALEWIVGELGLAAITLEHLQNFCWYQLPMKWLIRAMPESRSSADSPQPRRTPV
jgi:hypothetical protein